MQVFTFVYPRPLIHWCTVSLSFYGKRPKSIRHEQVMLMESNKARVCLPNQLRVCAYCSRYSDLSHFGCT